MSSRRKSVWRAICVTIPAIATAGIARAQSADGAAALQTSLVEAIAKAERSVVAITPMPTGDAAETGDDDRDVLPTEFGSGIIIAPQHAPRERLILTNYHVVRGGPVRGEEGKRFRYRLRAHFPGRRHCNLEIIAADPRSDLAVLAIDYSELGISAERLTPIPFGDGGSARKGQFAIALGNPYAIAEDGSASASWGIISNTSREPAPPPGPERSPERLRQELLHHAGTLLHVDTRLDIGTSGGALVNLEGELIGITTSLVAKEGYEKSVGFAVALDAGIKRIIATLAQGYEVEYGFLGVVPNPLTTKEFRRLTVGAGDLPQATGAIIQIVLPNSPADRARMQPEDIVLAINGTPVKDEMDVHREIALLGTGATARIRVWRRANGRTLTLRAKLGKWPVWDDEGIIATRTRFTPWRGVEVDHSTGRRRYNNDPFACHNAVVITEVAPLSKADEAGLKAGDFVTHVNGTPVRTPAEFHAACRGIKGKATLRLLGRRSVDVGA